MNRLTPLSKFVIIVLILGGAFFGLRYFGIFDKKAAAPTETTSSAAEGSDNEAVATENESSGSGSGATEAASGAGRAAFDYTPPAVANGKLKGVVELGATGFNSFIINIDAQKNWELKKSEFGNSLVTENMATDEDIRAGLKKYIGTMLDFGVGPKDIHFVVSSGAAKADVTPKITKALKSLNYYVNTVTAEQEGTYALKVVLPPVYEDRAFVVDIGSGNTKISWKEGGKINALEGPGAKYFQKGTSDSQVYDEISATAKKVPGSNTKTCFIIGGAPFKMAKEVRKDKERYTVLKAPADYNMTDAKDKAGVNIYKAIADATGCQQFVFDWDANFTIGFLLDLPH